MANTRWLLGAVAAVLCLLASVVHAQSIIAVDPGTTYSKVVLVQPGKLFDIALSPDSKRKYFTGIGVVDGVRSFGSESFNVYGRRPQNTVWRVRDMLGRSPNDPELLRNLKRNHLTHQQLMEAPDGTGAIRIDFAKGTKDAAVYSPEELFAMLIAHAKENAERDGSTRVSAVSLTAPSYINQARSQAMMDAVEIAGLSLLGIVDENIAAAVQYAIDRTFNETATNILFYNMGAATTEVTIVQITGGKEKRTGKDFRNLRVLAKAWDESLGVENIDVALAEHFAKEFDAKHPHPEGKIFDAPRAIVRLKKEAQRIKEILSGLDRFPATFGSLHRDIDFKSEMTRNQMEQLAKDVFDRVHAPVARVLKSAGLNIEDIHLVEVIGGGFRVPGVKAALRTVIPEALELSTHINGDEGMAFGCAFCAANVSTTFHVPRLLYLQDAIPREIRFWLKGEDLNRDVQLFPRFTLAEAKETIKQTIKFRHDKDFTVTLVEKRADEDDPEDYPESLPVGEWEVTGMKGAMESFGKFGEPKVHLTFTLDRNLLVSLAQAEARFDEEYEEQVKKPANSTNSTDESDKNETVEVVKKTRKHIFTLTLKRTDASVPVKRMTAEAKAFAQARLQKMDEADRKRIRREEARNSLEAFSFTGREKLDNAEKQVALVTTPEYIEDLRRELAAVEDWIDDHKHEDAEVFDAERARLAAKVDKIFSLIREHEERPAAVKAFRKLIRTLEDRRANWTEERPWISEKVWEVVDKAQADALQWIDEVEAKQKQLTPSDEPALTVASIRSEMEKIQRLVELLLKQRRPPQVGTASKDNKTASEKAGSDGTKAEGDSSSEGSAQTEGEPATPDGDAKDKDANGGDKAEDKQEL